MAIFDTHAHYDDSAFDSDRDETLERVHKTVGHIINCCADIKSLSEVPALAEKYDFIYFAAGLHPEEISDADDDTLQKIKSAALHKKCVAVGEIGLDYHLDGKNNKAKQQEWFKKQLELAKELELPVIIHSRDAAADTLEILKAYRPKGVMHCFSGSPETMREILDIGMYIGLGGVVTFKNAKNAALCAAEVPPDRLLLETDCPYMAPVPFRGTRNDSSLIYYVAEKIASLRGLSPDALINAAEQNAKLLFGIE